MRGVEVKHVAAGLCIQRSASFTSERGRDGRDRRGCVCNRRLSRTSRLRLTAARQAVSGDGLARNSVLTAPVFSVEPDALQPDAVGVALALMARLALGRSHRQAGNGRRVAPSRLSPVLDLEESPSQRAVHAVSPDVRALIREMCTANPLWGAPRIHGELRKLGISVSQSTVAAVHAAASAATVTNVADVPH